MLGTSITRNSILLGLFAVVAAGMLAGVNEGTKERIAQEVRIAQQRALYEIVPQSRIDNDLLMDTQAIPAEAWDLLGLPNGGEVYIARQDGDSRSDYSRDCTRWLQRRNWHDCRS